MTLALAAAVGFLAARLLWLLLRETFAQPLFLRENYRGHQLPTAAGVVLALAALLVEAGRQVAAAAGVGDEFVTAPRLAAVFAAVGFGLLGAVDDLAAHGADRGFRGHVVALARGRLTTGGLKLWGGAATGVVAVSLVATGEVGVRRLLADAALVALAANLGNLFDRAPGRVLKVGLTAAVALAIATGAAAELTGPAVILGAAAALFLDDLHERLMLGDAGANVLGGTLGLAVVVTCAPSTRDVVLIVVLAANLLSEVVSFGRLIDGFPPLRALDLAGRRHR